MFEMSRVSVPIVVAVLGEGGSGGALAIGIGDSVGMLEYSYYSVISPEGCAAILWRSGQCAPEAAMALKPTARELKKLGIIDEIIREPLGGAHRDPQLASANLEKFLTSALSSLVKMPTDRLLKRRWERLRKVGTFFEKATNGRRGAGKKAAAKRNGAKKEAQPEDAVTA
ncbi:MAG: hypothetical protein JXQ73_04150 [Phycisphaerae bacterium]|nr:hypothetical protein [Phycisphaerae bacterium]